MDRNFAVFTFENLVYCIWNQQVGRLSFLMAHSSARRQSELVPTGALFEVYKKFFKIFAFFLLSFSFTAAVRKFQKRRI